MIGLIILCIYTEVGRDGDGTTHTIEGWAGGHPIPFNPEAAMCMNIHGVTFTLFLVVVGGGLSPRKQMIHTILVCLRSAETSEK